MLGGADNPNGELPSYITGADKSLQIVLETLKQWHMRCIREAFARHGVPLPVSPSGRELRGYDALTSAYARARNSGRIAV